MPRGRKGKLVAMLAMSALIAPAFMTPGAYGQVAGVDPILSSVPAEQAEAYQDALQEGPSALIAFMQQYPNSPLIPAVIEALSELVGVERAIQLALDAGVPTEVVFTVAALLSVPLTTITGQAPTTATSPY